MLNFNDILISPFNSIITLLFFLGLCNITNKLQSIFKIKNQNKFLEFFLLLICAITFFINLILLLEINLSKIKFLIYIIPFLGIFFLIFNIKILIQYYKYINENNTLVLKIFLLLIFLNTLISPLDIDTLDYHIGFSGYIENAGYYNPQKDWYHSVFFFNGEVIGLLGLIVKSDLFLNFLNFIGILILFRTIELTRYKSKTKTIIKFLVISCPVILQLIISGKPYLFPLSIIIFSFYELNKILLINNYKNKYYKDTLLLFIIIIFGCSFRYEFYILLLIIFVYFLIFKISLATKLVKYSIIGFLISIFPILLRNYKYFKDPLFPFLSSQNFGNEYVAFINGLGSLNSIYGLDKILIFPFNLFISTIPGYFITTLGFAIIPIIFAIRKKFLDKQIFIIVAYSLILIVLGKLGYPRFYVPSFILFVIMSGFLIENSKIKFFRFFLVGHIIFSFIVLLYSLINYGSMILNENFKDKILTNTIENYYIYKTISKNYSINEKFIDLTGSRNHFYKRKLNINSNDRIFKLDNSKKLEILSIEKSIAIVEKQFVDYLIRKDIEFKVIEQFNYKLSSRNSLFNKIKNISLIRLK